MADTAELPEGWKAVVDARGRTYYFNRTTRRKSWTRPTLDGGAGTSGDDDAADSDCDGDGAAASAGAGSSPDASGATSHAQQGALETGSGAAATTSADPDSANADDGDAVGRSRAASATVRPSVAMEGGWVEVWDDNTGMPYYFHKPTKRSSWTMPAELARSRSARSMSTDALSRGSGTAGDGGMPAPMLRSQSARASIGSTERRSSTRRRRSTRVGGGWVEVWDETSAMPYYFHKPTKRSSWTMPPELARQRSSSSASMGSVGSTDSFGTVGSAPSDAPGEHAHAQAGTGGAHTDDADDAGVGEVRSRRATTDPGAPPAARLSSKPLPHPWRQVYDAKRQRPYFYNRVTKKSHWRMPPALTALLAVQRFKRGLQGARGRSSSVGERAAGDGSSGDESDPELPPGWRELKDSKGRTYYYHRATKRTSWNFPTEVAEAAGGVEAAEAAEAAAGGATTDVQDGTDAPATASTAGLPEGWTAVRDPAVRRTYYFHEPSGRSSWTQPTTAGTGVGIEGLQLGDADPFVDTDNAGGASDALGTLDESDEAAEGVPAQTASDGLTATQGEHEATPGAAAGAGGGAGAGAGPSAESDIGVAGRGAGAAVPVAVEDEPEVVVDPPDVDGFTFPSAAEFPAPPRGKANLGARVFRSLVPGAVSEKSSPMVNFTSIVGLDAASFKDIGVNNDDAVFEGYLWKKGHGSSRFGMQNWKKRYFVLEHGTLVYYTDASLRRRKGVINVYGAALIKSETAPDHFGILPRGRDQTSATVMRAQSKEEARTWLAALKAAGGRVQRRRE